jgi:hypothetical protein
VSHTARPGAEDRVLANGQLRAVLRSDNLTVSAEDLTTHESWGSDPWENSAGRIQLKGKTGESVSLNLSSAADKKLEALPGRVDGSSGVRISLAHFHSRMGPVRGDRDPGAQLSVVLQVWLAKDRPELKFRIDSMHNDSPYWKVEQIEWPLRVFPVRSVEDDGYIAVPQEQGFIVPSRFDSGYFRYLNWVWDRIAGQATVLGLSMPWYGARKGQSSFICIVETPDDVGYGVIANDVRSPEQPPAPNSGIPSATTALYSPRISAVWPYWRFVKGELGYARVATYTFQPHGGYVEMCKTYRKYAQKVGKFVTLKQKIAANPEVAKLIGAPNFEIHSVANRPLNPEFQTLSGALLDGYHHLHTSFDQVASIVHDLKENLGVNQAVIRFAGWGRDGYDNVRPIDALQVNAEAGGQAKLVAAIQAAKNAGFLAQLWDNYRNLDLNSNGFDEKYIIRDENGARVPGFSSESGPSEEICPLEGVKLIRHAVDFYQNTLKANAVYLDTIGGLGLVECYDARHALTRSGVREARLNIMRTVTGAKMVLGAEGQPQDWNLSEVSFYDEHPVRIGVDVPLYGLVYHDCAMLYQQHGVPFNYGLDNYGFVRGTWPEKFLRALLYGDQSSWTVSYAAYNAWRSTFKSINDILAPHQKRLAFDELTSHELLTPDLLVQRTRFSSGVQVTVNYGEFPYKLEDGTELVAHGYNIKDSAPGGRTISGRINTEISAM